MFKNFLGGLKEIKSTFKDERKKTEFIANILTSKKLVIYGLTCNIIGIAYFMGKVNEKNFDLSMSRWVSRKVGRVGDITIPTFLRKYVYSGYMKMYNINKEEILDQNLENYKTIKEFFIRKIDLDRRPIENPSSKILSSPCDGRVLTISEVQNLKDLIIVKDVKYTLGDFLFGKFRESFPSLSNNLYNKDKKVYQMTIYLSPGDCHRYYSPNNIHVSERVYVPGFLEPVRPSYLDKHPMVFRTNERVTLKCQQENSDDFLYITYVGALNVGSIYLSFDDFLKTNVKLTPEEKRDPGFYVVNYSDIVTPNQKKIDRPNFNYYQPRVPLLIKDLDQESEEFDMRDMLDLDMDIVSKFKVNLADVKIPFYLFKERFIIEKTLREREDITYNFSNSFLSYDLETHKKKSKLSNPKQLNIENFKISDKGVYLQKKDEMGWFNFGSTIVLIFSIDKDREIKFMHKAGDVVKIGQTLFDYI